MVRVRIRVMVRVMIRVMVRVMIRVRVRVYRFHVSHGNVPLLPMLPGLDCCTGRITKVIYVGQAADCEI